MSTKLVSVEMDDTLRTVKNIFDHAQFHHLLVVDRGKLYGVISDRDLLKSLSPNIGTISETASDTIALNKKAHQIMTRKPVTLKPGASVQQAIRVFNEHNLSCIPVVDENERPVGIFSWRDILKAVVDKQ